MIPLKRYERKLKREQRKLSKKTLLSNQNVRMVYVYSITIGTNADDLQHNSTGETFQKLMGFYAQAPDAYLLQLQCLAREIIKIQDTEIQTHDKPSEITQDRLNRIDALFNTAWAQT